MSFDKSTWVLDAKRIISTFGVKAAFGPWVGMLLAASAYGEISASQIATAPTPIANLNPQLTPEMFSPEPSGPLQAMKEPKAAAKPTILPSRIMQPPRSESEHTARAPKTRPSTKKHVPSFQRVARHRPIDIRPYSTDELSARAFSSAPTRPQFCAPPFHELISPHELGACGLLPLGNLLRRSSETEIY